MEYFCESSMDCNGSYNLLVKSPSEYLCINKQRQIVAAFGLDKVEVTALVAER
ncbi:hypothetical protein LNL84_01565 [Vibrio sp. ZSDZ34]|uniref:Uncharacterized protein n=1 Tax=Vibrio gelatinilyticus TaxID=2893468 RepID=A0A9X2AU40_9VIBR|nr:hypothetical protein [Vibrio gelatinilyticus]MCJ2375519.1 hypothetical protein [Vibrio gelatinilyticus]